MNSSARNAVVYSQAHHRACVFAHGCEQGARRLLRTMLLSVLGCCGVAQAHHSASPHYDTDKTISIAGVVNKFELVNPHAYVYFIANDAAGKPAQWRCELSAKAFLVRMGWTQDTFKVGDKLTFKGAPARREDNVCMLNAFVRADGTEIDSRANLLGAPRTRSTADTVAAVAATSSAAVATVTTPAAGTAVRSTPRVAVSSASNTANTKDTATKQGTGLPTATATSKAAGTGVVSSRAAALSADADPALSGYWVSQSGPGGMGAGPNGMGGGLPGMGPGQGAGQGLGQGLGMGPPGAGMNAAGGLPPGMSQPSEAGRNAAKNYDQRFDDPAIKCSIGNILFGWTHDQNVNEITQSASTVTLRYGYMDYVRTIHLDQTSHPAKVTPSVGGHSIGHWEHQNGQRTLVVDTVGFAEGVLQPMSGVMHSTQLHVVERFTVNADGTLTRSYTVEDPLYLTGSYSGSDVMARSSEPYTPYNCTELSGKNNQRS